MATYVISDIHGHYEAYAAMLEKIGFSDEDTLYILGDILDRGPHPIQIILDIMERPNVEVIAGNHEVMAMECFRFLLREITEDSIADMDEATVGKLLDWQRNGSASTTDEFHKLDRETRESVVEFISEFELYDEVSVNGRTFILVHAGLGNFRASKEMWEYELDELVWQRPDYDIPYFEDKYVVSGHTPTMLIEGNPRPGYIYKANQHIAIDCGCSFPGGRLGCLRLEDMAEFYVEWE